MFLGLEISPLWYSTWIDCVSPGFVSVSAEEKTNKKNSYSVECSLLCYVGIQTESFVLNSEFDTYWCSQTPFGCLFTVIFASKFNSQMMFCSHVPSKHLQEVSGYIEISSMTNTPFGISKKVFYVNNVRDLKNNTEYLCLIQRP